ncbi:heme/hemin ABC transporter substrate-binding protein [Microbacterium dextranolyticum]|uniref:ABC transporter substrate-binding protein n=1 Tax=Microbacterium dextranolyticum TaxID=36806 RepID=A0A9W6HM93_9MICO|nr:ABC transporter substrate-binding protein [Microbacterium dextranolyticum]MBM7464362.1 iron complex transport system substrate-binding protein [Microbacterium dextranolyticum]GLJ95359.1 ABC transporter substrate-binding protein [Microbacterium dextranolyticum]
MHRRSSTPLVLLVLSALTAAVLTGCTSAGAATARSAEASDPACPAATAALSTLQLVDDVRGHVGPSTACLASRSIPVVADDTAPVLPVTVIDAEGREVTVADASRILPIDISGTIAATVFALGLGGNVVGKDTSTNIPGTEDLPLVTKSGHTLNAEAILGLAPTVVLTDTTIGPKEVRQQLRDAGIAVVVISSERRLDTTDALVTEVAAALGVPTRGTALAAQLDASVDAARQEIATVAPTDPARRARMLFLYVRGSANVYYIFGEDSGADSLIDAVGGVDVAAEIGWSGMKPMTAEALVAAQPDVLVMMTDGLSSVGGIDGLLERIPAIAQTPAGAHRRVIDMADTAVLSFGPRTADVVRSLAGALYAPADFPARADASASPAPTS